MVSLPTTRFLGSFESAKLSSSLNINSQHEIRNSKEIQMTQKAIFKLTVFGFGVLDFFRFGDLFVSTFVLDSIFGFRYL